MSRWIRLQDRENEAIARLHDCQRETNVTPAVRPRRDGAELPAAGERRIRVMRRETEFDHRNGPRGGFPAAPSAATTEAFRGVATLMVSLYLLGLLLSVAANSRSGASALVRTIHDRLFSPWMVPAWLDLGFDYHFTHGIPDDAHHVIEGQPWGAAGPPQRLPPVGSRGERAARWRRLARTIARGEADPDREGVLPEGMAAGLFSLAGADDIALRVVRMVPADFLSAGTEPVRDVAFAARLRRVAGRVQLIRDTPAEELAPLLPGTAAAPPQP